MDISNFLKTFAEQFEDTDVSLITPECEFHELDEWSSLISMSVIAMAKTQFGVTITGKEIRECETVEDLFNLINSK